MSPLKQGSRVGGVLLSVAIGCFVVAIVLAAVTLDELLDGMSPRVARTLAQEALRKLSDVGAQRLGLGKRGSPYRYFRAVEVSAGTQIPRNGRNGNEAMSMSYTGVADVADRISEN